MSKAKASPRASKKSKKVDNYEPTKVALMVACVAATSLVLLTVVAISTLG